MAAAPAMCRNLLKRFTNRVVKSRPDLANQLALAVSNTSVPSRRPFRQLVLASPEKFFERLRAVLGCPASEADRFISMEHAVTPDSKSPVESTAPRPSAPAATEARTVVLESPGPGREPPSPTQLWLHRTSVFLFVLISAVAGVLLVILPWTSRNSTDNNLLISLPWLRAPGQHWILSRPV